MKIKIDTKIGKHNVLIRESTFKNPNLNSIVIVNDYLNDDALALQEEGVGSSITLSLLISLIVIPGILEAAPLVKELKSKPKVTMVDVGNAVKKQSVEMVGSWSKVNAVNVIARTLFDEARGEGDEGMDYVATVIWNRAGGKAAKLPGVCLAKYQFSGWNSISSSQKKNDGYNLFLPKSDTGKWETAKKIAAVMVDETFTPKSKELNSYYNPDKCSPSWGSEMSNVKTVGHHKFGYLPEHDGWNLKIEPVWYVVKGGDSLGKIAKANNIELNDLIKLNNIKNPNKIKVGQKIRIS